jgi:hypothetical protein
VNELLRCFGKMSRTWHWSIPVLVSHWEIHNIHISPAEFEPTVPVFERFKVSLQFEILYFKIFLNIAFLEWTTEMICTGSNSRVEEIAQ